MTDEPTIRMQDTPATKGSCTTYRLVPVGPDICDCGHPKALHHCVCHPKVIAWCHATGCDCELFSVSP